MALSFFLTVLTEHHLKYLLEDTFDAQTKRYFIGLHLDLTHSMLSAIKTNNPSSGEQYTEMLLQWISGGPATLKGLIDALEANTVKLNGIAEKLKEKYAKKATPQEGRPYDWDYCACKKKTETIVQCLTLSYLEIHKS